MNIKATILKIGDNTWAGNYEENAIPENRIAVSDAIDFKLFAVCKWNGTAFIEGATVKEITEMQSEKYLQQETKRYEQRTIDGQKAYAKISAEFRLAKLAGIITEQAHAVIEKQLIGVRNEILAGQWKSGLIELETLGNAIIGVSLYNRLHTQITTYITENY